MPYLFKTLLVATAIFSLSLSESASGEDASPKTDNLQKQQQASDAELSRRITGAWIVERHTPTADLTGRETYLPDGRFTFSARVTGHKGVMTGESSGTWQIKDSVLILTTTASTFSKPGQTHTKIISISEKELVIQKDDGSTDVKQRSK